MKKCDVSVVIISYNQENFIKQTLNSIISQILHQQEIVFEVVIGDDCSTDKTAQIIREFEVKYPDLVFPIYNKKNIGAIKNYYNVLSKCDGEIIMQCAGDDYWLNNKICRQLNYMRNHDNVGMCCCDVKLFDQKLNKFTHGKHKNSRGFISFEELLYMNTIYASSVCFRRNLFERYLEETKVCTKNWLMEDYPLMLWFSKNSYIYYDNFEGCVYRCIPQSISHPDNIQKKLDFEKNVWEIQKYFANGDNRLIQIAREGHYRRTAYIYSLLPMKKQYRNVLKKSRSKSGKIKYYLSFFPYYFSILKLKRKI